MYGGEREARGKGGGREGGGTVWGPSRSLVDLSGNQTCRVELGHRLRKEKAHPNLSISAELTSAAGSQAQGEGRGSSLSIHSLPSGPSSPFSTEEQPVASWGQSFERLLQDPRGLAYFTVRPRAGWNGVGRGHCTGVGAGGCWRGHRQLPVGRPSVLLLSVVPVFGILPLSPSWELSLLVLISAYYFLPVPQIWLHLSVCLVSWPSCLSQSLNTSLNQPVSEGLPSPSSHARSS